jgi:RecJ-like exonuclease
MEYRMLTLLYPEKRQMSENAVLMWAADTLVDQNMALKDADASTANTAWFGYKETLSLDEAMEILVDAGLAEFEEGPPCHTCEGNGQFTAQGDGCRPCQSCGGTGVRSRVLFCPVCNRMNELKDSVDGSLQCANCESFFNVTEPERG